MVWVANGLLLGATGLDAWRARRVPLEARRIWPRLLVQDHACDLELELESSKSMQLRVREVLHPSLAEVSFRHEVDLQTAGKGARMRHRVKVPIRPLRRGRIEVGPLLARVRGPWGLVWSQRTLVEGETVKVYPRVRWGGRVGQLLALARRRELGSVPVGTRGLGGEMYALRGYQEGDPRSRIHWRATAKRGRLIVREDVLERGAPLVVLFDAGRSMNAPVGRLGKLDYALAAGLAMIRVAASRGDRIRVAAFSDRIETQLAVRSGEAGIRSAYERLYDLQARPVEPLYDVASEWVRGAASGRATVVLFTSVVDLAASQLLQSAVRDIARRHRVLLVNLEDPVIRALAEDPPTRTEEVFAKLYSLDILLHNRRLATQLRRRGITTVSASADQLALATLESYFALLERPAA